MIEGHNIVCIGSNWFDHPTSKHHVMRLLSKRNHVLWVNFHASRRPKLTRSDTRRVFGRLAQAWRGVRRVAPHIDMLSPLLIPMPESRLARFVNGRGLCRQIRRALRRLPSRPTQLWLFTPDVPELIGQLGAERVVYYCVDDFAAFAGFNTTLVEALERRTVTASDVVITTSARLYEQRRTWHRSVHLLPHGVDFDHFATAADLPAEAIPEELRSIRGPVLGYMGLISHYVDLNLIAQAALQRPDWSFVFIGNASCDLGPVSSLDNVHLLGARPYEQLPAYCRRFDVGLIPFRMSRLVQAVNPIKLREYLAAGLPVVSAPMAEVLRYAPAVQTARTLDEFVAACRTALEMAADGNRSARQDLVRSESWDARVALLSELVTHTPPTAALSAEPSARPASCSPDRCSAVDPHESVLTTRQVRARRLSASNR